MSDSLTIGKLKLQPNVLLAPMSGVTNSCFRRLIKQENPGAVGLLVTEFISIEGLTRGNEQSLRMMRHREEERPLSIQIFGYDIDRMVCAAQMAEDTGADIVDINCGCPAPKVVKKGGGCELMRQPLHLEKMLRAVSARLSVPLTLKIRAGWDPDSRNALEIARIAEGSGVAMLAVHGRTRTEMYRGEADWELVQEIAGELKIPVVGSGDIECGNDALERLRGGVSAVMIGRRALSNPWVFTEIAALRAGRAYVAPPPIETVRVIERYRELLLDEFPERAVIGRLKQFVSQVTRRVKHSKEARTSMLRVSGLVEFDEKLARWADALAQVDTEMLAA